MKKQILFAIAAVSALPAAAIAADGPSATVYGNLNLAIEGFDASGAPTANSPESQGRFRLNAYSSYVGFKGTEDLGDELKAFFQIETGLGADVGVATGSASSLVWFNRNTGVGLNSNYGQVTYGLWDTPFKTLQNYMEPTYATGQGYLANILDSPGFNTGAVTSNFGGATAQGTGDLGFNRREGNSVQYWSPKWGAFQVKAMYGFGETVNKSLWGGSLTFEDMGITAGVAMDVHNDYRTTGSNTLTLLNATQIGVGSTKDTGIKATLGYKFGDTQIAGVISSLSYTNAYNGTYSGSGTTPAAGAESTYSRLAYGGSIMHKIGNVTLRGAYTIAADGTCTLSDGSTCGTSGFGANQATLGASYSFSKRTDVYLFGTRLANTNGAYTVATNPILNKNITAATVATTATPGADMTGKTEQLLALGIRHTF